jgi:hypothetical protein
MSATDQSVAFEQLMSNKLNQFCSEKKVRLGSQDKPFITAELKRIKRQKSREYIKRGKTKKYKNFDKFFETNYKIEAENFLNKNLDALRESNPGQAYSILKNSLVTALMEIPLLYTEGGDCSNGEEEGGLGARKSLAQREKGNTSKPQEWFQHLEAGVCKTRLVHRNHNTVILV